MSAATNPCAKCNHATRPLPTDWSALDFFDHMVVEQDAALRASCDAVPDTVKPCLRPAPAASSSAQTESPDMAAEETFQTFPFADSFEVLADDSAVYLCGQSVARLNSAVQGIHTLTAMLMQRELDADVDLTAPCKFGPNVAMGILSAIACCTEVASAAASADIFPTAQRVRVGSAAHQHLEQAARQAGRMSAAARHHSQHPATSATQQG